MSKSALYGIVGNAISIPVVRDIGLSILECMKSDDVITI
jgi:hypothetical protein